MKILKRGIAYSGAETPGYSSCSFPSVCQLSDGAVFASFKAAERKIPDNKTDHAVFCISCDNGVTWSEPIEPFEPPVVDGKPTTIRTMYFVEVAPDNLLAVVNAVDATLEELPYYNEKTEGLKETYIMFSHSADGGKTWKDALVVFNFGKNMKEKKNAGMNDVWSEMGKFNVGHPFVERLDDGTIMVYFYSGPSTHRTDFCYVMVEE